MKHLISSHDLDRDAVDRILRRARELRAGAVASLPGLSLASLFLTPSMRTRVGFEIAAQRLGGSVVRVDELRRDASMSSGESYDDALRVLAGMVDVVVSRVPFPLAHAAVDHVPAGVVNGGDGLEHPTQALIDLAGLDLLAPAGGHGRVALCGDLTMRAVRSLLALLEHRPPEELIVVHPDSRAPEIPPSLQAVTRRTTLAGLGDVEALVMIGLPPRARNDHLDAASRAPYVLTGAVAATLPEKSVVLSPMPVIDEIDADARRDPRIRMFEQSDHAVFVRMAVLEHVLAG